MQVLLLDDHDMVAEAFADRLRTRGQDVNRCPTPAALIAGLESGAVDAVILDVRLDEANGLDVLATIRVTHPELPVIVVTGFDSPDVRARAAALSVLEVLRKGESLDRLCAALDSIQGPDHGVRSSALIPTLRLSARKIEILRLLAAGQRTKQIAAGLGIQRRTVAEYVGWLEHRLGASTPTQLVGRAIRHGFIAPPPRLRRRRAMTGADSVCRHPPASRSAAFVDMR